MASLPPFSNRILLQRPVALLFTRPTCLLLPQSQIRYDSSMKRAEKSMERLYKRMEEKEPIGPSMRTQQQTSQVADEASQLLLPHTFITPPMRKRPSIFGDTRNRLRFEWVRVKIKWQDVVSRVIARLWYKDPLFRNDIVPSAEALHRNMYTAYARGDIETLSHICGRDLYNTFRNRIVSRPGNVKFSWKFSGYNSKSKIVSHKVGMLGMSKNDEDTVRQVVVKIDSTQTLTKGINGKVVKGTGEPTRTTEYVVLSKRKKKGVPEGPWVVWGTVGESGMEDINSFGAIPMATADSITGGGSRWN
ncbi:hypothetical protein ABW19_dt0204733 [Dactylella cylindrospora]|nr:hypothetical protein ABW19_dt0204733 [Dactylella cylindrospora]